MSSLEENTAQKITPHSKELADLAESELPCADLAKALLEIAERE